MSSVLQVCYVVVSSGWDRHAQMAWLSATSVRLAEPNARVVIVLERTTPDVDALLTERFSSVGKVLLKTADIDDPVLKSRYHRIALREYLPGDILYIDSDTLAIRPFAEDLLAVQAEVGAVIDFNDLPDRSWCPPELEGEFRRHGWTYPIPHYMNAGVVFLRDTPRTHALCEEWMRRWLVPAAVQRTWDQPTLNSAIVDTGVSYKVLPNAYNAMIVKRNYRFREAKILHFFGSEAEQQGTLLAHLLTHLERHNEFDRAAYDRSIRQGHPWGPNPEPWQLRHSRNHVRAAYVKAMRTILGR